MKKVMLTSLCMGILALSSFAGVISIPKQERPRPAEIELSGKLVRPMKSSPHLDLGLSGHLQIFDVKGRLLDGIQEGTAIRVKGVVRSHYHKGGSTTNPSPFPAQWMIWLEVTELETL